VGMSSGIPSEAEDVLVHTATRLIEHLQHTPVQTEPVEVCCP